VIEVAGWLLLRFEVGAAAVLCFEVAMVASVERARWAVGLGMPRDNTTVRAAAAEGRLEVLMCLHGEGCQLDASTCTAAAGGGHLDVLIGCMARAAVMVMVTVAKSFDAPIKLLFPRWGEVPEGGKMPFSMLGLGDIVIPGIFVALVRQLVRTVTRGTASKGSHSM
jgi:hypothetical protein